MPKNGELMDEYCYRVSDLGIPITEDGMKLCEQLDKGQSDRDQNRRGMYIYNDWNGWGMSEVMENYVCFPFKTLRQRVAIRPANWLCGVGQMHRLTFLRSSKISTGISSGRLSVRTRNGLMSKVSGLF
jgi:hypothetical protein